METINYTDDAINDLQYWKKTGNIIVLKRIRQLVQAVQIDPYTGIGKPEALKHNFSGFWSKRINQEHRIVYQVMDKVVTIYSLRYHYSR